MLNCISNSIGYLNNVTIPNNINVNINNIRINNMALSKYINYISNHNPNTRYRCKQMMNINNQNECQIILYINREMKTTRTKSVTNKCMK